MKMYKQEDYGIVMDDASPPSSNTIENYILNQSPSGLIRDIEPMLHSQGLDANILCLSPPPGLSEDTVDVGKFQLELYEFPVSPHGPPDRTVFPGDVDFQVEINASDTHKKKYLYSNLLNRIYVDMRMNFPVWFRWLPNNGPNPAYVRACVVFSDESQAEKRVERCTQHTHDATNATLSQEIVKNVLHSSREMGTDGVFYCGRPERADSWYSVLVQMGASGTGTHAYQFVCKNSCSSGINRRAIDVLFTLEDSRGHVYGRQIVGARVCACPRRDILRDEGTEGGHKGGKRRVQAHRHDHHDHAHGKKVKLEARLDDTQRTDVDDNIVTLPPLQIVGSRAMVAGLEVMLRMSEQAANLRRHDLKAAEKYRKSIDAITKAIEELTKQ